MASRPSKRRKISPPASENRSNGEKGDQIHGTTSASDLKTTVSASNSITLPMKSQGDESEQQEVEFEDEEMGSEFSGFESGSDTSVVDIPSSTPQKPRPIPRTNTPLVLDGSKGSVIKMQVDELLNQVTPKYGKKEAPAEDMLRRIKAVIEGLQDLEPLPVHDAEKQLLKTHKIAIPFPTPRPSPNTNIKLAFVKPASINVVGSYVLKTATRIDGKLSIDMVVNMSMLLFSLKDYLDYRYFYKRAYYIACIAAGLQSAASLDVQMSFSYLHGNSLLPIILIQPSAKDISSGFALANCDIRIIPAVPEDFFPISKTLPNRTCIRSRQAESEVETDTESTPFYNASIRVDSSVTSYLKLLHSTAAECAGFREACILGRVWLRQRGFGSSLQKGGFGHFEWATLIALLLQGGGSQGKPVLLSSYDGYQLFRATIQFLAVRNMIKQPLLINGDSGDSDKANELRESDIKGWVKGGDLPMCFDQIRGMNVLYKLMPWSYTSLRKEAQASIKILTSMSDPFESLFIYKIDQPLVQYDLLVRMSLSKDVSLPRGASENSAQFDQLYNNLVRGLGDRAKLIKILLRPDFSWSINNVCSHPHDILTTVGIVLDLDSASRTVDKGPSAEDVEAAAAFREFWGDKAELRRFKDGQILECVAWDGTDPLSITKQIIQYVIHKYVGGHSSERISFLGNDFSSTPINDHGLNTIDTVSEQSLSAFRLLENHIRSLDGLPLQIRHFQAARPGFRRSVVPSDRYHGVIPTDVMIQFEGSGRWPDDLAAITMTKIAFLLKLDELLRQKVDNVAPRLGLENEHNKSLNHSFLDVIYPGGAAFRLRIHHEREQTLIERRLNDKSIGSREREDAAIALANYKKTFIQKPRHTQAMQTLVTKFRAITGTILLVKAWFNSHLLGNHFPEELIEIIVARLFLQPYPWQVPSSAMTGFLRTLHFLAEWEWRNNPLIVDFAGSIKKDEISAIHTRFEAWRKIDPSLNRVVMFVATNYDNDGTTWTEHNPAKVVAGRMTSLAKAANKAVSEKGIDLDLGSLFRSPLKDFDFVIHINPRFTTAKQSSNTQSKYKNLQLSGPDNELIGYNPVQLYVDELQSVYGESFVLFCDWNRQETIAGLWSPHTASRRWKVNLPYSTIPARTEEEEDDVDAAINKGAILQEMARLGGDMVKKVESNSDSSSNSNSKG